jgi:hypothetical protein
MVPLPETILKIVFQNTLQQCCHGVSDVMNVSKSSSLQAFLNLGKSQKSQGAKSSEYGGLVHLCTGFLSQELQHSQITLLIHRLSLCNEFLANYPLVIGETQKNALQLRVRPVCLHRLQ